MKNIVLASVLLLCFVSCKDQGEVVEYLEIVSLTPASGSVGVGKATPIKLTFNRPVDFRELKKIRVRYLDDTTTIQAGWQCGLCPTVLEELEYGAFIWKPGRTIEAHIPNTMQDENGRTLRQSHTLRFSVGTDATPFDLFETSPHHGDTISLLNWSHLLVMKFTDYAALLPSTVTVSPPAQISIPVVCDTYSGPTSAYYWHLGNIWPNLTYTITISRQVTDYEGETLPQDYRIVFYTRP